TIASLAPGAAQTLTMSGTAVAGQYENTGTASVTFGGTTYTDSDDSHYFGAGADLSLVKSVDNAEPQEGDTIVYTITLANDGPSVATGVQITDALPAGLSYVSDNGGGAYDAGTGVWSVASLASGSSTSLAITATVDTGTAGSTITNTAEVTVAGQPDPDSTPNNHHPDEDDQSSIDLTVQSADLVVEKTVDNPTPSEGDTIVYTITLTNDGPSDASGITLSDTLPVGVTYVSDDSSGAYDPFTGVWTVGALANGEIATLNITATVDANTASTTITNMAEVTTSDQPDPDPTNNRDTADITVTEGGGGGGGTSDTCEGKIIINEVAWSGTTANSQDEWIELRNLGTIPVDLSGWTLQWRRKKPETEEEKRWKIVDLSGMILPAEASACDLAQEPQTASVNLVKTDFDAVSWQVVTEQERKKDESFYTLERRHDDTISNAKADLVYDESKPYRLELSDFGDVIQLLNADGEVVDTANAFNYPNDGWPAGDAAMHAAMERTDPLRPDTADNWHTNLGIITWGEDAEQNPLIATASTHNSDVLNLLSLKPDVQPAKTRAGARLEVGLEVTQEERRAYGWPWVRVTQPGFVASAGGGGALEQGAGFTFSGRYTNGVYWLGIDTAKLLPGRYNVWVVYGGGKTVLVPIEVLP
ncbi:MAG: lamin tail domain-containing protein, partial [Candidatus Bipolaricaulota bacterium]|nr:lamin tail domain-containing protein [Candidatus Bipolaricaulota bacterium]